MSSKDNDEECVMHSKGNSIETMINDKADEVIEERFESLLDKYQIGLETSMRGGDFIFDCVHLLYYKCHKINPSQGGSQIESPDYIKNKKATINPINKEDNKCFQFSVTIVLNHEEINKEPQRTKNIKTFVSKYNQEGIKYHQKKMIGKSLKKIKIAVNVLYAKNEKTYPA